MPGGKRPTMSAKKALFCREYLKDLDASKAARRAGYAGKNTRIIGYNLLKEPAVKELIQKAMDERAKRVDVSADMVLQNIKEIACFKEFGPDQRIRASDVLKANELLGKHLKLFTDKVEVEGKLTLEQLVADSLKGSDEDE